MNQSFLVAEALNNAHPPVPAGPWSWIVDALAYGTFGVAAVILVLAYKLYSRASTLTGNDMKTAQSGAGKYMKAALFLTIPCVLLQALGLVFDKATPPRPDGTRSVKARIHVPPMSKEVEEKYGSARISVVHGNETRVVQIEETPQEVVLCDGDIVTVSVRGMTELISTLKDSQKPKAEELRPSALK